MLIYTELLERIFRDIVDRVPEFHHIDMDRVAVLATARCTTRRYGNLANCCTLSDPGRPTFSIWTWGRSRRIIAVSPWYRARTPAIRLGGQTMTYLITVRLPRIIISSPLETLVHELYHIGEEFDGSMRPVRHGAYFDQQVRRLTAQWLRRQRGELARLAQLTFAQLQREHGPLLALGLPQNFKVPYLETCAPPESYREGVARLYPGYSLTPAFQIRPAFEPGEEAPLRVLTEKHLILRSYDRHGTRKLPQALARYARQPLALSA